MKYNNLLLDIDGTIVGTNNSPAGHDSRLTSKLNEYLEKDGKIGIVTGRSRFYSSAIYEVFGLNGPRIVEMGSAIVMPDNKIISLNELHQKNEIISMLKRLGIHKIMMEEPKEFMISLLLNNFPYHDSNRLEEIYDKINEKIRKRFPDIKIRFDRHSIDIYNPNVNKGAAIKIYAQETNLSLENFAIVGDSMGDFPGFKVIGEAEGFVGYVGFDEEVAEKVRSFKNNYISREKRSSGLVEIMDNLLN